jgi:hypothetical protein
LQLPWERETDAEQEVHPRLLDRMHAVDQTTA